MMLVKRDKALLANAYSRESNAALDLCAEISKKTMYSRRERNVRGRSRVIGLIFRSSIMPLLKMGSMIFCT
jgi:hypothetical protein